MAEAAVRLLVAAEDRFALLVGALDVGAAILVRADDLDARVRLHRVEEAVLALGRAVVPFGVAQQDHLALAAAAPGQPLAAELAALVVVGGDEADVVVALQPRVEDHDRDLLRARVGSPAPTSAVSSSGASTMPDDAAADEVLDLRDLRVAIVLAQRAAPDDRRRRAPAPPCRRRRGCFARTRARSLWDDRDRERRRAGGRRTFLAQAADATSRKAADHRISV